MLVTVLIPCRNDADSLPRLMEELASLAGLLAPEHFPELLLVDGGSNDGTVPLAIAWCERASVPARLIALDTPGNFAEILRESAALIAGDIVLVLDPSCACPAADLVRLVRALGDEVGLAVAAQHSVPLSLTQRILDRVNRQILRWRTRALLPADACVGAGPRAWRQADFRASLVEASSSAGRGVMFVRALLRGVRCSALPLTLTPRRSALAARTPEFLVTCAAALGTRPSRSVADVG